MFLDQAKDQKDAVFDDPDDESNIVGFYDLLLKIDKRKSPENYLVTTQQYD